ncbi:hypothetical protein SPSIL_009300 [Sporomusa silvacetica DSM 10669]|uniref:HTH cro/C1-type domain-containing protein n=1 Tax=Sporomusa silvacetica DSM 10669 TaxID=1123289 RepID=A0ABZ3IGL2_9FIRM|nr:hypothetical protein [Sporomusa silvacetica]OZC13110.1 hypothetical protein SPSIL_55660 [Sporomusa silvacetica DSM 10669]
MATFQEKLDHACRVFSVTMDEVCVFTKTNSFSFVLHATGQRQLSHNEMVLLCQFFNVPGEYFTNERIRFVDEEKMPDKVRDLMHTDKPGITCYEVTEDDVSDMTDEQIFEILSKIPRKPTLI